MKLITTILIGMIAFLSTHFLLFADPPASKATNPVIWADVPDVAVLRVDDTYYMSSTTMHMSPGLPIMKSKDLVNWKMISYAYETLADNEMLRLENGKNAYGAGSWASSLRYQDDTFIVSTFSSTSGKTHFYKTKNPETGPWEAISFEPSLHDHTLIFDDDGRVYMLYGVGALRLRELKPDLSGILDGGVDQIIIENVGAPAGEDLSLPGEGSQLIKKGGYYYLLNIAWPTGDMRTVTVHRADKLTGPWEGRLVLQDKGVAQGSLIDTPDGRWYALLFQDSGAVGRCPWLVPVTWEDGWPVFGVDGKAPVVPNIPAGEGSLKHIVGSDEFSRGAGDPDFSVDWQWNHNPVLENVSLTDREGWLRITTGRVDTSVLQTRNTLTQRTFGPQSSAETEIDVSGMEDGDIAGMIALQRHFGYVGVLKEDGKSFIVMKSAGNDAAEPEFIDKIPFSGKTVQLKIHCDFQNLTDKAHFYYRMKSDENWTPIGETLRMRYTLPHFMGYRFGLFNQATQSTGGHVDFNYYRIPEFSRTFKKPLTH